MHYTTIVNPATASSLKSHSSKGRYIINDDINSSKFIIFDKYLTN